MRWILIICVLFGMSAIQAQQLTMYQVDSLTYQQFINNQYKDLIKTGKQALRDGKDFYYLHIRLALAQYNRKNYDGALLHFQRARTMYPTDKTYREYEYFANLFSNRAEQSALLAETYPDSLRLKMGYQRRLLKSLSIGGGALFTNNISQNQNNDMRHNADSGLAVGNYRGNVYYGDLGLQLSFSPRFSFYLYGAIIGTQGLNVIQTPFNAFKTQTNNTHGQINAVADYYMGKGWSLTAGVGYYKMGTSQVYLSQPAPMQPPTVAVEKTPLHSFLGSVTIAKRMAYLGIDWTNSVSNLVDTLQWQSELGLTYYPFGNTHFYGRTTAAVLYNGGKWQPVFSQQFGGKITQWLWYDIKGSVGNLQNYNTNNGVLAYNTFDPIKATAGADLRFCFKHFEWKIGYQWQMRQASTAYYPDVVNPTVYQSDKYNYSNHLLKTQLIWKF